MPDLPNKQPQVIGPRSQPRASSVMILGSFGPSMVLFRLPLIEALRRHGCKVIAAIPLSELGVEDRHRLEQLGVALADAPVARHSVDLVSGLRYTMRVARLLKLHGADALVSYTAKPVIFGAFAARVAGVRRIVPLVTGLGSVFTGAATTVKARTVRFAMSKLYRRALSRPRTGR